MINLKNNYNTILLRLGVALIFFMHSVPGMFNNGINDFGNHYLNEIGFSPFGLYLAWLIKLSHLATAIGLLLNKCVKQLSVISIFILIVGIFMVHIQNGWFVVGGGSNGVEYNFLLICVLLSIIISNLKDKNFNGDFNGTGSKWSL
jgi:putative oxidoreductase